MKNAILALTTSLAFATSAQATSESSKVIAHVGAQGGSNGYVTFVVPPTQGCSYNNIYFDISTDAGKAYYALLLSAKASNTPISRVDYTKDSAGNCTINLIEI